MEWVGSLWDAATGPEDESECLSEGDEAKSRLTGCIFISGTQRPTPQPLNPLSPEDWEATNQSKEIYLRLVDVSTLHPLLHIGQSPDVHGGMRESRVDPGQAEH